MKFFKSIVLNLVCLSFFATPTYANIKTIPKSINEINKNIEVKLEAAKYNIDVNKNPLDDINIDKLNILVNFNDLKLQNKAYRKDKTIMFPLKELASEFNFKVSWNNDLKKVEVTKDNFYSNLEAYVNKYTLKATHEEVLSLVCYPETIDGVMYAPLEFFTQILDLKYEVSRNNTILFYDIKTN